MLPTNQLPTDIGVTTNASAPSAVLRALGLLPATANPENEPEETFGQPAFIGFNSDFSYDFNPFDGIDGDKVDFDAVATHEIGHALGFFS